MSDTVLQEVKSLKQLINQLIADRKLSVSRWCRGDKEAALFVGFRSPKSFRAWAEKWSVFPRVEDGVNMWDKNDLDKAADKAKRKAFPL